MSILYKLGEGPINYDWNKRYCSIEATELIYSQATNDNDSKTINIQGAAVSNICKIKGKNFSFCISIPPPLNKIIYLAADSFQECSKFREKCLKATQNHIYNDNIDYDDNEYDCENDNNIINNNDKVTHNKTILYDKNNNVIDNPFKNKPVPEVSIY